MTTQRKKVLLTAARSYVTLDLARKLHHAGHTVIAADTSKWHISKFSNAIEKLYTFPSPRYDCRGFMEGLVSIIEKEQIDVVIPIWEEILCIAQNRKMIPESVEVFCSSFESLRHLHNKWLFMEKLKSFGFRTPKCAKITKQEDLENLCFETSYALKPSYSRAGQEVLHICPGDPLPKIECSENNPWVAQEWIEGQQYSTYSVCHNGKLTAHSTYPLQISLNKLLSLNYESVDHQGILNWVKAFVAKENFTGQIAFDFMESREGTLYPIECNPRSTSGVHLFQESDSLDRAYFDPNTPLITPQCGSAKQLGVGMLMYGWRSALRDGKLKSFFQKFFTQSDIIYHKNDKLPFLMVPVMLPFYCLKSLQLKKSMPAAFHFDLEWDENIRALPTD